jgi:hypothetical protein
MYAAVADGSHDGNRVGFGGCSVLAGTVALTALLCCILGDDPMKSNITGGRLFSCWFLLAGV